MLSGQINSNIFEIQTRYKEKEEWVYDPLF